MQDYKLFEESSSSNDEPKVQEIASEGREDENLFEGVLEKIEPSQNDVSSLPKKKLTEEKRSIKEPTPFKDSIRFSNVTKTGNLHDPSIYANRLLGIRVNTTEKIVLKKQDGVVTK